MTFHTDHWKSIIQKGAAEFGIQVTDQQAEMMAVHAEELMIWNRKTNLTAITDPADIAVKHFIDSIVPSGRIPDHASLIDIGTGGGFPGIPLKILRPSISMTLVDSSRKKVNFIKHVIRILNLENIEAVHARIEDLAKDPRYKNSFDFAISRAFTELSHFAGLASPFLNPTGRLIAMKSRKTETELKSLDNPCRQAIVETYTLPFQGSIRTLIILDPPTIPLTQDDNLP